MKKLILVICSVALCFAVGCRDVREDSRNTHESDHDHSHGTNHDHAPPHGGTPVLVAADKFHLELVLDNAAGTMQAYVLDGHLDRYVQVPETEFTLVAKSENHTEQLTFKRAPDHASGEVPARSALFEARADWLKSVKSFAGQIPAISLNGSTFTNISFGFPKGTKHVH